MSDKTGVDKFEEAVARFQRIVPATSDELVIVLKGHLMIEEALRCIVASSVACPEHLQKARLTFVNVLYIARALVGHLATPTCWAAAEKLNSVRNKLAHQAEPDPSPALFSSFFDVCEMEPRWAQVHVMPRGKEKLLAYITYLWSAFDCYVSIVNIVRDTTSTPLAPSR